MKKEKKDDFSLKVLRQINNVIFDHWFPEDPAKLSRNRLEQIISAGGPVKIVDVKALAEEKAVEELAPAKWVDYFYGKMAETRYAKSGVWAYACKMTYDPEAKAIMAEDCCRATAKVADVRNRPVAYVKIGSMNGEYRFNAARLDSFLYGKGIDARTVRFEKESLDTFYAYYDARRHDLLYFVRQTHSVRQNRINSPSADFWRMDVNKVGRDNEFELTFAVWEDHLVEESCGTLYVSDLITEEDYKLIRSGYFPGGWHMSELDRICSAMKNKKMVEEAVKMFKEKRSDIQQAVNNHSDDIVFHMADRMGISSYVGHEEFKHVLNKASQRYGFDCGWVNFMFCDAALRDAAKTASMDDQTMGVYSSGEFSLNLPYETQSTNVQSFEAEEILKIVKEKCGINLTYTVCLD